MILLVHNSVVIGSSWSDYINSALAPTPTEPASNFNAPGAGKVVTPVSTDAPVCLLGLNSCSSSYSWF